MKRLSMSTMLKVDLSHLDTTSSPHGLMMNTRSFLVSKFHMVIKSMLSHWMIQILQCQLTGEMKEQSTKSRTKNSVDHAGPSLQPQPSREHIGRLVQELCFHFQSSNWLIVIRLVMVAMAVFNLEPCNTWLVTSKTSRMTILTKQRIPTRASKISMKAKLKYLVSTRSCQSPSPNWRQPLSRIQHLSVSRLTRKFSNSTNQESLILKSVELRLTMLSLP